jgi:hypothetical protein
MNPKRFIKKVIKPFLFAGLFLLAMKTPVFADPCASSPPLSRALSFDRQANGQMFSLHDCNGDGVADYKTHWTVIEFMAHPLACADPYDPRYLIVPRSGFYRISAEPVRVVILTGREQGDTLDSRPFLEGGRW